MPGNPSFFERTCCEDGWMPGSSPGMTSVFACTPTSISNSGILPAYLASTSRTEFDGYRWRFTHPTRLARPLQKKPLRWNDDHHLTSLKPMQSLRTIA
jgi:hypothetical protein